MTRALRADNYELHIPFADTISVAVACDTPAFARKMREVFDGAEPSRLIVHARESADLERAIFERKPHLCVLHLVESREEVLAAVRRCAAAGVRALVAGDASASVFAMEVVLAGGWGVIDEDIPPHLLARCFQAVLSGQVWISRKVAASLLQMLRPGETSALAAPGYRLPAGAGRESGGPEQAWQGMALTPREMEIADAIANGNTNREIAEGFGISLNTVKCHISRIFQKTGVRSRARLIRVAIDRGAVPATVH